jgi:hypothetical protein
MPMREELYIPLGHPLRRAPIVVVWPSLDADLVIAIAFAAIGLTISIGLMLNCPLAADPSMALVALS